MLMPLDNGVLGDLHAVSLHARLLAQLHRHWRRGADGVLRQRPPVAKIRVWNRRKAGYAEADLVVPIPDATGGHGGADPHIVEEFLGYVRDGRDTLTSAVAAREAVAAGYAATQSLRSGGVPVAIAPPPSPAT